MRRPGGAAIPTPAVHDSGSGPALVLLHAFPLDASQWNAQVEHLHGRYRCLRPDWFGCGASPAPPDGVTLDDYAAAVLRALDGLGVGTFGVAGLSMGGYTAFALLRRAAERVTGIVLAATRAGVDGDAVTAGRLAMAAAVARDGVEPIVAPMVTRLLSDRARLQPHIADGVRARIRGCTPAGIGAGQLAMAGRPDSTQLLPSITVPTLVIGGDADPVTPPGDLDLLAAGIAGARRVTVEGVGHLVNLEAPDTFNRELDELLAAAGAS